MRHAANTNFFYCWTKNLHILQKYRCLPLSVIMVCHVLQNLSHFTRWRVRVVVSECPLLLFIVCVFVVCDSGDNYMSPGILAQLWVEEEKKRKELERKLRETLQANQVRNFDTGFSLDAFHYWLLWNTLSEMYVAHSTVAATTFCVMYNVQVYCSISGSFPVC